MAKPVDTDDLKRLVSAQKAAVMQTRYPRQMRAEMVKHAAGAYYFEDSSPVPNPINFTALYRQVIGRALVSQNPRVLITTFNRPAKPMVAAMETWMNDEIKSQDLQQVFSRVVDDALFWFGIVRLGLATPSEAALKNYGVDAGEPYLCRVSPNNYWIDPHAEEKCEAAWECYRYRVPLETIRDDSKLYSKARKDLTASTHSWYNASGDEQLGAMSRMPYSGTEEFDEMVDLCEFYLPRRKMFVVLPCDPQGNPVVPRDGNPLRAYPWIGQSCEPYYMLGLQRIPDNLLPIGPIHFLFDLDKQINNNARKVIDQSHRLKKLTLYRSSASEDMNKAQKANDGDAIPCEDPDGIREVVMGGPDEKLLGSMLQYWDIVNKQAGNVELAGGLSPQSKTLGQDKMLNENATRQIADMQDQTVNFVSRCLAGLGELYWHHPALVMETHASLPGMPEISVAREPVTPLDRIRVKYSDLKANVDPYSLQHKTPMQMVQEMDQVVQQVILPAMGLLQQQGCYFDINTYLSKRARYMNNPDIMEIISVSEPPEETGRIGNGGAASEGAGMPNQTERTYTRRSVGSDNPTARAADFMNSMAKAGTSRNGQPQGA